MRDIVWTDDAKADIQNIRDYIAAEVSDDRADHVIDAIDRKVGQLAGSPRLGNWPKELAALGVTEFRELHWKPYRIIYGTSVKRVVIYGVFDGRRDMKTLLQERLFRNP